MARILVIDDESSVRTMLKEVLYDRGHSVEAAPDGETGIALAREKRSQIVLLDMNMPGMDGLATLERLRALAPPPVVIMMSGIGDEATARRALEHGAFDYIEKPIDVGYLEGVLRLTIATLG